MEKLFENKFVAIFIEPENELLFNAWTKESSFENLTFELFKDILSKWQSFALEYKVKRTLTDARELTVLFVPEWQEWTLEYIHNPLKQAGFLKKQAYVLPIEFIPNIGVDTVLEESEEANPDIELRRYTNIDEAKAWLLQ